MGLIAEATETAVANEALGHLGASPIVSIDSGSDFKSKTCRSLFPTARDTLLRRYPWNFAEARAQIAAASTPPLFGFSYSYPLPNTPYCLAVRELPDADKCDKWRVVGRSVYCDLLSPISLIFTYRCVDVALWDPQFRTAFSFALASLLARPIAKDADLKKEMEQQAQDACNDAFPVDASEGNDDNEAPEQDIIRERF